MILLPPFKPEVVIPSTHAGQKQSGGIRPVVQTGGRAAYGVSDEGFRVYRVRFKMIKMVLFGCVQVLSPSLTARILISRALLEPV